MDATGFYHPLPDAQDSNLSLAIPTTDELEVVYRLSFAEWGDSLTLPEYLEESEYLTKVPLAENYGMVSWILTDKDKALNLRPVLASCETFRKRAFVTNLEGELSERIVYGIASVFVNPKHRSRGYGRRLMQELATLLNGWHAGSLRSTGSILYSDIGKSYYTKLGWQALPVNVHIEFGPRPGPIPHNVRWILDEDLPQLCLDDEQLARESMTSSFGDKVRMMIVPDVDHMQWHISKEKFSCQKIFGNIPQAKGAIAGERHGSRIWAFWARRYYSHPNSSPEDNTLYILRFVVENQNPSPDELDTQASYVKGILQAAQAEAAEWDLSNVKLWHPIPLVQKLVERSGLEYQEVEREEDSIASLRWFDDSSSEDDLEWVASEKYAWV